MNRPTYETGSDLRAEREIVQYLSDKWGLFPQKLPTRYILDYAFSDRKSIKCFVEIKDRKVPVNQYPDYMISVQKVMFAKALTETTKIKCGLVVRWNCGTVGVIDLLSSPDAVRWGGRNDREDLQDMEPCIYWNLDRFTSL